MKELRLSVCYPMPLNLALDQEIKTYAEHYGFSFLGSGTDGYSRDIEFSGSIEHLERESLLLLLVRLLQESIIIKMYCVEMIAANDIKDG
jgi:hypothetical protein